MTSKPNIDIEVLIILVEARPVLWDKTLETYKDKILTKNAWIEICQELHRGFDEMYEKEKNEFTKEVMKRWWNVRDSFVRSRKRQKEARKSGAGSSTVKKYVYSDQLQFLNQVIHDHQTEESLVDEEDYMIPEVTDEGSFQDSKNKDVATFEKPQLESKKRKLDPLELKMIQILEEPVNRHLSFFKGIIPSLNNFDEDQVIQFQLGVLQLISNIKRQKLT